MDQFYSEKDKKLVEKELVKLNEMYHSLEETYGEKSEEVLLKHFIKNSKLLENKHLIRALAEKQTYSKILTYAIENIPSVKTMFYEDNKNIAMISLLNGNIDVALNASQIEEFCTHQDINGYNLGMWATIIGEEELAIETMKHKKTLNQLDHDGCNIGIVATIFERDKVAMKSLENPLSAVQQDKDGFNLLMWAVAGGNPRLNDVIKEGLNKFPVLGTQQNKLGHNVYNLMSFKLDYFNKKKYIHICAMPKLVEASHSSFNYDNYSYSLKKSLRQELLEKVHSFSNDQNGLEK